MSKVIVTAAISGGIHVPSQSSYLPITPTQIAKEAMKAREAGAASVHIHVREPETGEPSANLEYFGDVLKEIKKQCDVIVCLTTGGALGMPKEDRISVVPTFKPELASFNMGSMNFALYPFKEKIKEFKFNWEEQYLSNTEDLVFANTFKTMKYFCCTMLENNTKPELEIYDVGMINNVVQLINERVLNKPVHLQFVMGILGGIPATVENLVFLLETAKKQISDFTWSVCAAGKRQFPMAAAALALGGNVRVGLEDNLYLEKGILAKSNSEQVAKIVRLAKELSVDIATPSEARRILGLKGLEKVNF